MNFTDGNLYWINKNKIKYTYPYLTSNKKCDILVVGGGISSAIISYYLAKEGFSVVIAEKNVIGYGSTSASSAVLDYQSDIDFTKLIKLVGENKAKRLYKLCVDSIYDIKNMTDEINANCEFELKDNIYFSNKFMEKPYMLKEYEERKKIGIDISLIENTAPIDMRYGILSKEVGAQINPYMFTQEMFNFLNKLPNVEVYENTEIIKTNANEDRVESICNNYFKIFSNKIIYTPDVETLKQFDFENINAYKTYTLVSKQVADLSTYKLNFIGKNTLVPYNYLRFTKDNRIIFSGENTKVTEKLYNDKMLKSMAKDKYKKLYDTMQKVFLELDDIDIEYCYNGTIFKTKDTFPIIDEVPNMPNAFCCSFLGNNGIIFSNIGGKLLKDAVKGYFTKDMQMFRANR